MPKHGAPPPPKAGGWFWLLVAVAALIAFLCINWDYIVK